MVTRLGYMLYAIASCIAVVVIAGGVVVWLYFAHPNKDPLGLVIVGWGIIFGLAVSVSAIGSLVDKTTRQQPSPIALVYCGPPPHRLQNCLFTIGAVEEGSHEREREGTAKPDQTAARDISRGTPSSTEDGWRTARVAFQPPRAKRDSVSTIVCYSVGRGGARKLI